MPRTYGYGTSALEAVLTAEHQAAGFWLCEDEDFLYLYHKAEWIATFSAKGATIATVREEADRHLKRS